MTPLAFKRQRGPDCAKCGGGSVRVGGLAWSICRPCGQFTIFCRCLRPETVTA
jgi:hypothetical protein